MRLSDCRLSDWRLSVWRLSVQSTSDRNHRGAANRKAYLVKWSSGLTGCRLWGQCNRGIRVVKHSIISNNQKVPIDVRREKPEGRPSCFLHKPCTGRKDWWMPNKPVTVNSGSGLFRTGYFSWNQNGSVTVIWMYVQSDSNDHSNDNDNIITKELHAWSNLSV